MVTFTPTPTPYVSRFDWMSEEEIVAVYKNLQFPSQYSWAKRHRWAFSVGYGEQELFHDVILTEKIQTFTYRGVEIDTVEGILIDYDANNDAVIRRAWIAYGYVVHPENGFGLAPNS